MSKAPLISNLQLLKETLTALLSLWAFYLFLPPSKIPRHSSPLPYVAYESCLLGAVSPLTPHTCQLETYSRAILYMKLLVMLPKPLLSEAQQGSMLSLTF